MPENDETGISKAGSVDQPAATIVIATRNRADDVARAVASALANTGIDLEVIVVDQSDGDHTERALAALRADERLRYIHSDRPGKTRAMNQAIELARGRVVLFTDDDCELPPDWASTMVRSFDADPRIGVVFCSVVAGDHDPTGGFVPVFIVDQDHIFRTPWRVARPEMGAGMALRSSMLRELGGFDEAMGPGGRFPSADDTDVAFRALRAGWHVTNTAATAVIHHGFRTNEDGAELTRRDWFALGGVCGKAIRCRAWAIAPMAVYLPVYLGIVRPLVEAVRSRSRPRGLGRVLHFARGFGEAVRADVDPKMMTFVTVGSAPGS